MSKSEREWGLAAMGCHGNIEIELDEPIGREGPWHLQIRGKGWWVNFDVAGANAARDISAFVKAHANRKIFAEHRLGAFQAADVVLVKDSEFTDRFWLRIHGTGQMVEITLQDEDAVSFEKALEDLISGVVD